MPITKRNKKPTLGKNARKGVRSIVNSEFNKRTERKRVSTSEEGAVISYNGTCIDLSNILIEDTVTTRTANKVIIKELDLRYSVKVQDNTNLFRLVLFRYMPLDSAAAPVPGTLLLNTGSVNSPQSQFIQVGRRNIKVYYDRFITLSAVAGRDIVSGRIHLTRKQLGDQQTNFNSSSSYGLGKLFLLAISDSLLSGPELSYYASLKYTDL